MSKKMRYIGICATILLLMLFCILAGVKTRSMKKAIFNGDMIGTEDQFIMDFSLLNTEYSHKLSLKGGDCIAVSVVRDKGDLKILISGEQCERIYLSSNADSGEFKIIVPATDVYTISVVGDKAAAKLSFVAERKE